MNPAVGRIREEPVGADHPTAFITPIAWGPGESGSSQDAESQRNSPDQSSFREAGHKQEGFSGIRGSNTLGSIEKGVFSSFSSLRFPGWTCA